MIVKKIVVLSKSVATSMIFVILISCNASNQDVSDKKDPNGISASPQSTELIDLEKKLKTNPNDHEALYQKAEILYQSGNYPNAISDLERAISIDSSHVEYYHLLSDAYLDYYQSGEALDILVLAADKFDSRIPTLLKLAELQLILKQYDASFFTVQKILNQDKQNAEAFFMMGMIYRAQGEKERAINSFQTAVEMDPEIIDAWIILGDLFAEKDFTIAERYYNNAISLDPNNPQTYHAKAFYLQNNGRENEAIELYKKINSMDPQYVDAYLNTGILYLEQDSLDQAMEHFNIFVRIEPQSPLGYYYRGITKMFSNDKNAAKEDLEQSLIFDPNFEKARIALEQIDTLQ